MTAQPTPDAVREQYAAAIRPNMLMCLQDAELDGPGGTQRINEWVDWIAKELAAVRDREMEQLRTRLDAAEKLHQAHLRVEQRLAREQLAAETAIARVRQMADHWEQALPDVIRTPAVVSALRAALDRAQQPTTKEA